MPFPKPPITEFSTTSVPRLLKLIPMESPNTDPFIDRPRMITLSVAPMFTVMVRASKATIPAGALIVSDFVMFAAPNPPLLMMMTSPLTEHWLTAP